YILVVLGDDPSFFQDKKLFPEISRVVYKAMTINTSSSMSDSECFANALPRVFSRENLKW
ncbi:MAG: hypothetical protein O1I36_16830, partial [Cylindrospermopsis raciborskii PAMP2011]|nr:hypothetical protein [Cylindrospermopsis raciborskii PAMP2011]